MCRSYCVILLLKPYGIVHSRVISCIRADPSFFENDMSVAGATARVIVSYLNKMLEGTIYPLRQNFIYEPKENAHATAAIEW